MVKLSKKYKVLVMVLSFAIGKQKSRKWFLPQTVFTATIWGAVIEWLLPVSVSTIPPDIEMLVSISAVLGLPRNLKPSNILRLSRAALVAGLRNPSWISSSPRPRVSGMKTASMTSVKRDSPPKKKYAPKEERARKMGVAKATSQFVNYVDQHVNW